MLSEFRSARAQYARLTGLTTDKCQPVLLFRFVVTGGRARHMHAADLDFFKILFGASIMIYMN